MFVCFFFYLFGSLSFICSFFSVSFCPCIGSVTRFLSRFLVRSVGILFVCSFNTQFPRLFVCSVGRSVGRSVGCEVGRSGGRSLIRSVVFLVGRAVGSSVSRWVSLPFARVVVRLVVLLGVRFFVRWSSKCLFVSSFLFISPLSSFLCFLLFCSVFVCLSDFLFFNRWMFGYLLEPINQRNAASEPWSVHAKPSCTCFVVRSFCLFRSYQWYFIDHYLFISQCVSFCSDLNSPLPMDIRYWKEVEAAVGVWLPCQLRWE